MSWQISSGGTLVMPAVVPDSSLSSPVSSPEWLRPERWSQPPPEGVQPIVPCDEPEDDDRAVVRPAIRTPVPPSWLRSEPLPSFASEIAAEPVVLPMGRPRSSSDRLRLVAAALASFALLAGAAGAALALI